MSLPPSKVHKRIKSILSDQTLNTKDYRAHLAINYRVLYTFLYFPTTRALRNLSPRGTKQQRNGEDYIWRKFIICTAHRILMENNEMGGACGTYGGQEWWVQGFGGET